MPKNTYRLLLLGGGNIGVVGEPRADVVEASVAADDRKALPLVGWLPWQREQRARGHSAKSGPRVALAKTSQSQIALPIIARSGTAEGTRVWVVTLLSQGN